MLLSVSLIIFVDFSLCVSCPSLFSTISFAGRFLVMIFVDAMNLQAGFMG